MPSPDSSTHQSSKRKLDQHRDDDLADEAAHESTRVVLPIQTVTKAIELGLGALKQEDDDNPRPREQGEYEQGLVVCDVCSANISIRDTSTGGFSMKEWERHRDLCARPEPVASSSASVSLRPDPIQTLASLNPSPHDPLALSLSLPASQNVKRRRAKRTEDERIAYLQSDPYVAQFEAYRVLCRSCEKWIRLRPNSTYCSIPWDAHRKSCLAKKVSTKNHTALSHLNALFSKDPDIRKFDSERVLCANCDRWIPLYDGNESTLGDGEDHLAAVHTWLAHRKACGGSAVLGLGAGMGILDMMVARRQPDEAPVSAGPSTRPRRHPAYTDGHSMSSESEGERPPARPRHGPPFRSESISTTEEEYIRAMQKNPGSRDHDDTRRRRAAGITADQDGEDKAGDDSPRHMPPPGPDKASPKANLSHTFIVAPQEPSSPTSGLPIQAARGSPFSLSAVPLSPLSHEQSATSAAAEVLHTESRRRNAHQRLLTLQSDPLIKEVEPNRVFCVLCLKWVQLRQDSSYCAYPWVQHRGKCLARHERRAQKNAEIEEIKASRRTGIHYSPTSVQSSDIHPHSIPAFPARASHPSMTSSAHPGHSDGYHHRRIRSQDRLDHQLYRVQRLADLSGSDAEAEPRRRSDGQGSVPYDERERDRGRDRRDSLQEHHRRERDEPPFKRPRIAGPDSASREQTPDADAQGDLDADGDADSDIIEVDGPSSTTATTTKVIDVDSHDRTKGDKDSGQSTFYSLPPLPSPSNARHAIFPRHHDENIGSSSLNSRHHRRERPNERGHSYNDRYPSSHSSHHGQNPAHVSHYQPPPQHQHHHHSSSHFAGSAPPTMMSSHPDLEDSTGRKIFISQCIFHLFSTTFTPKDDLSVSALVGFLNAAVPADKFEDFGTGEVVKAITFLEERGRVKFEGDILKRV